MLSVLYVAEQIMLSSFVCEFLFFGESRLMLSNKLYGMPNITYRKYMGF